MVMIMSDSSKRGIAKIREERKRVLIALEDTKSAKYYFQSLLKEKI